MAEDKLKQEIFYMVSLTSKYDFTKMEVVEGILRLENDRRILDSVFGRRFKSKIFDIAAGVSVDNKCVICGQPADNKVICQHCMSTVSTSDYAKSKIKAKKASFKMNGVLKRVLQYSAICILTILLCIQSWLLYLLYTIEITNPYEDPVVSTKSLVPVDDVDDAKFQLSLDFPEEYGYTITYVRKDEDYVGRFLLDRGDCCNQVEKKLTDKQRYDYFFKEPVYVFYVTNIQEHSAKLGIAEVNSRGAILVMGSFNDGRQTDSFYKYR